MAKKKAKKRGEKPISKRERKNKKVKHKSFKKSKIRHKKTKKVSIKKFNKPKGVIKFKVKKINLNPSKVDITLFQKICQEGKSPGLFL